MTNLFNNYENNTTIPDNRYKFLPLKPEYKDVIVKGAEAHHCFKIPYSIDQIQDVIVMYYQGIKKTLLIPNDRIILSNSYEEDEEEESIEQDKVLKSINPNQEYCWAKYTITEEESLLFNWYNKQTQVQLRIVLIDGTVEYSGIYKIKVLPTLFTLDEDTNKDTEEGEQDGESF